MLLSTSIPNERMSENSTIMLRVMPMNCSTARVMSRANGIALATIKLERRVRKNGRTNRMSNRPVRMLFCRSSG